jgi:hypothetical protein
MFTFNFAACSDDDDNPPPATQTDDDDDDDDDGPLAGYTATDIMYDGSTVKGYSLDQFVSEATIHTAVIDPLDPDDDFVSADARKLYAVSVVGSDGFSNRTKFSGDSPKYNYDLRWDLYISGYLLEKIYDARTYFPSDDIVAMYDIKNAQYINMYRKIDVVRPDGANNYSVSPVVEAGTIATFEIGATATGALADPGTMPTTKLTVEQISFWSSSTTYTNVNAIKLEQFITSWITDSPSSYTYNIVAVDDFARKGWTWDRIRYQDGTSADEIAYYLPDDEIICVIKYDDADTRYEQVSQTKINFPVKIVADNIGTAVPYDFSGEEPPAYAATQDLQYEFPEQ